MTRCKFRLDSITQSQTSRDSGEKNDKGHPIYKPVEIRTLKFSPVYGNNDPNHENTKFWNASPSGSFELGCVNLAAVEGMKIGQEFYIDISAAE